MVLNQYDAVMDKAKAAVAKAESETMEYYWGKGMYQHTDAT